jgi:SAM-dependent methyltransferase
MVSNFRFLLPSRQRSLVHAGGLVPVARRREPCRFCGEDSALKVARITFWDIQETDLVICRKCRLAQLDPMLKEKAMSNGVYAYYLLQRAGESAGSVAKNTARNFRKGYAFAKSLPGNFAPKRILELGPGDGGFLRGVRSVFPAAEYYAWDLVPEVAKAMEEEHGFKPLAGSFEKLKSKAGFDLVIARDVIEHFAEVADVLRQVAALLNPGGLFHFITPNGHEDIWKFYVGTRLKPGQTAELLLNHVNYFDGWSLDNFLQKIGLRPLSLYTYDFSSWKLGIGWRVTESLAAGRHGFSAAGTIRRYKKPAAATATINLPGNPGFFRRLWYRYKYLKILKFPAALNFGHEIHGLYRK